MLKCDGITVYTTHLYLNVSSSFPKKQYLWSKVPLDVGSILELLISVHAYQILKVGPFLPDLSLRLVLK